MFRDVGDAALRWPPIGRFSSVHQIVLGDSHWECQGLSARGGGVCGLPDCVACLVGRMAMDQL